MTFNQNIQENNIYKSLWTIATFSMPSNKFSYLVSACTCTCTCTVYLIRRSRRLFGASKYTQQTFYMYFRVIKMTHKEITLYKCFIFPWWPWKWDNTLLYSNCAYKYNAMYTMYKLQSLFDRIKPIQAPKPVITVNVRIGHQYNRLPEDIVCLGFICAALSPPYCPSSGNSH